MNFKEKLFRNALISEKLYKLSKEEKHEVIIELLVNNTERGLAKELGIPHSTIHDWKSLRQNNVGNDVHISFNNFYRKIESMKPEEVKDWGRLEMIKEKIEDLLRKRM